MFISWSVYFLPRVDKDLNILDAQTRRRIIEKIEWLGMHLDDINPLSLTGEFKGFFKLRVGSWRIFYKIDWHTRRLIICYIGHRKQAYK